MSSMDKDATCRTSQLKAVVVRESFATLCTDRLFGLVVRRERVLVRERRQRDVPPLQEILIFVRFAQLHALRDSFLPKFLQDVSSLKHLEHCHTWEETLNRQLTAGSLPLFLNFEMRSSVMFFVGMVA